MNAEIIGINVPEILGGNCPLLLAAQIGINPINDQSKSTSNNQVKEEAQINPNTKVFTLNSMARERHEVDSVNKKKKAHGLGWTEAKLCSKHLR